MLLIVQLNTVIFKIDSSTRNDNSNDTIIQYIQMSIYFRESFEGR